MQNLGPRAVKLRHDVEDDYLPRAKKTAETTGSVLKAAVDAGAGCADYILLRLPHELTTLFCDWLDTHYPGQKEASLN